MHVEHSNESVRRALALLASLNALAGYADAQHTGVWGGFGVVYGSFGCVGSFRCDTEHLGEANRALGGFATLATTLTAHLSVGGELNAWVKDKAESTVKMVSASAVVYLRPTDRAGLLLKGTIGMSVFENKGVIYGDIILNDRQLGGTAGLGIGYDVRLSPAMSLTPWLSIGRSTGVGGYFGTSSNMWQAGLGLTWH